MNRILIAPLGLAMLGACSGAGGGGETELEPGRWDITTEFLQIAEIDRPDELQAAMGDQQNITQICINEIEAAKPTATMFAPGASEIECQNTEISFTGGKVSGTASCQLPGVADPADMTIDGTYTRTSYEANWTLRREVEGEQIESTGIFQGRHSGAC